MSPSTNYPVETSSNRAVAVVRAWNRFWFSPVDPTSLGTIRLLAGLMIFYVHFAYSFDLQEFMGANAWIDAQEVGKFRQEKPWAGPPLDGWADYDNNTRRVWPAHSVEEQEYIDEWGANPRQVAGKGYNAWSIWYHVTDPTAMAIIHSVFLLIFFLFAIGFCTRISSVLAWLAAACYLNRAPTTLFGLDTMMNLLLLYLMIGPSGAALSVDRLLARHWARRKATQEGRAVQLPPEPRVSANLALRLMQVNLCIIYFVSGTSKLMGPMWWRGTAVWNTLSNPEFSPMYNDAFLNGLKFLCQHRWLWELFMTAGVAFTLFTELGFAFLVWVRPLRWVMIVAAALLHLGIAMFMGLNTFSLAMICLLCSFIPQEDFHRVLAAAKRRWKAASFRLEVAGAGAGHASPAKREKVGR